MCVTPNVSTSARHRTDRTRKLIALQHLSYNPTHKHQLQESKLEYKIHCQCFMNA